MSSLVLLGMMLSVTLGAATQRITGLGFALVSAPLLVLASGPITGVVLANLLSLITTLAVLTQTWRQVDVKRALMLAVPGICFVPIGHFVAQRMSQPVLMVAIGTLLVAALAAVRLLGRTGIFAGRAGAVAAGALSGFMNVTAGAGGPAITLYAVGSRWRHGSFIGSVQLHFALLNIASIYVKGLPAIGATAMGCVLGSLAVGIVAGNLAARHVSAERARAAVLVLAMAGAIGTIVKGIILALA